MTYPGAHTSATGGDFEVPIEIFDGPSCEEAFHHQQDAIDEESSCDAIDHILKDVNPGDKKRKPPNSTIYFKDFQKLILMCSWFF